MEIILYNLKSNDQETISFENSDNINVHEIFKKFSSIKEPREAKLFAINESISSHQLSKFKNDFDKINISSLSIYSNNRNTIYSWKVTKNRFNFC